MNKDTKKSVLLEIIGIQTVDNDRDEIELLTTGEFYKEDGRYFITYADTEATGFEGSVTTLKVEAENRVTMERSGRVSSQLIVEKGRRHQCSYGTEFGELLVGISGGDIISALHDGGGRLDFSYSIDINTELASENSVSINIKESVI